MSTADELRAMDWVIFRLIGDTVLCRYSTQMEAAWRVVEWLRGQGQVLIVKMDGLRTYPGALPYTILMGSEPRIDTLTASEGICLAAIVYAKRKGLL